MGHGRARRKRGQQRLNALAQLIPQRCELQRLRLTTVFLFLLLLLVVSVILCFRIERLLLELLLLASSLRGSKRRVLERPRKARVDLLQTVL